MLAILWVGLLLTLSRSSLGALLVGLAMLAALRWKPSRALVVAVVGDRAGRAGWSRPRRGRSGSTRGSTAPRAGAATSSAAACRCSATGPVWGYGSGSFVKEYRAHHRATATHAVGLAHDPDHDRRRAGVDRRDRLPRARRWSRSSACCAARAGTRSARRSGPRSWRSSSTRCCTPTSSRTRSRGRCSGSGCRSPSRRCRRGGRGAGRTSREVQQLARRVGDWSVTGTPPCHLARRPRRA